MEKILLVEDAIIVSPLYNYIWFVVGDDQFISILLYIHIFISPLVYYTNFVCETLMCTIRYFFLSAKSQGLIQLLIHRSHQGVCDCSPSWGNALNRCYTTTIWCQCNLRTNLFQLDPSSMMNILLTNDMTENRITWTPFRHQCSFVK